MVSVGQIPRLLMISSDLLKIAEFWVLNSLILSGSKPTKRLSSNTWDATKMTKLDWFQTFSEKLPQIMIAGVWPLKDISTLLPYNTEESAGEGTNLITKSLARRQIKETVLLSEDIRATRSIKLSE